MADNDSDGVLLVPWTETQRRLGGVSRMTVYRLVKAEELIQVNVGTRSFITAESIRAYVDRLTAASA